MLVGMGEHKMRFFLRKHAGEMPVERKVPAWQVGTYKGYNRVRVFSAADVVAIRAVVERVKAEKKAAWQARMVRRRLRWAGHGVERWRHRSREGPYGERPVKGGESGDGVAGE